MTEIEFRKAMEDIFQSHLLDQTVLIHVTHGPVGTSGKLGVSIFSPFTDPWQSQLSKLESYEEFVFSDKNKRVRVPFPEGHASIDNGNPSPLIQDSERGTPIFANKSTTSNWEIKENLTLREGLDYLYDKILYPDDWTNPSKHNPIPYIRDQV